MMAPVLAMLVLVSGFVSHCSSQAWRSRVLGPAGCPGDSLRCHLSCVLEGNASDIGSCEGIDVGCPHDPQGCRYSCSTNLINKRFRCGGYKNKFCRCFH
uniref:Putative secreted protein n=1 Tax=Ixodes ricinus TaxID=34613 RepID=A0A6B0UGI0_IXORI